MIRPGIRRFFHLPAVTRRLREQEVDEEVAAHIELRVQRLVRDGMPEPDARREALRRFGMTPTARDQLYHAAATREVRMGFVDRMDNARSDVVFALRQLRRAPAYTAVAIATLAIGIGANVTMFSTVDRLLFRPPPHVADPARVVSVGVRSVRAGGLATQWAQSWQVYQDLRHATAAFSDVAAYAATALTLGQGPSARRVRGVRATASYFPTLGVRPLAGRFFTESEAATESPAAVAVVSARFWQTELGADDAILGKTLLMGGTPYQVVGVAPDGFSGVGQSVVDVWLPMMSGVSAEQLHTYRQVRQWYWLRIVARLRPGLTAASAAAAATPELQAGAMASGEGAASIAQHQPSIDLVSVLPREARANDQGARAAKLLAAVSLLVLILACANIINLQAARAMRRRHEIAVRLALGISRSRLLGQLLIETSIIALAAGTAAVAIASVGGSFVRRALLGGVDWAYAPVDTRLVAYAFGISVVVALVTGLFPASRAGNAAIAQTLMQGPRVGHGARSRERAFLLAVQSAFTVVLLVGTGLFLRSLTRIQSIPTGIQVDRLLTASLNSSGRAFTNAQLDQMYRELHDATATMPDVEHSALATTVPFGGTMSMEVRLPGRDSLPLTPAGGPYYNPVTSDYFATLGTRLIGGRTFTRAEEQGEHAVIVNETAARLWWPGENAIGKCIFVGEGAGPCYPIVGVVEDARRQSIVEDPTVQFYLPSGQGMGPRNMIIRTRGAPGAVASAIRRQLQAVLPASPYIDVNPMEAALSRETQPWRLGATMFAAFGVVALVLGAIGLYGVLAYDVAQRTRELGVRSALGARPSELGAMVVQRGLRTVWIGGAAGFAVCLAAQRAVAPLLFRTVPYDPAVFATTAVVMLATALASTLLPARRAARADPVTALRAE